MLSSVILRRGFFILTSALALAVASHARAESCDDGNPCTVDSDGPPCTHQPLSTGYCLPEGQCTYGYCMQGVCIDSHACPTEPCAIWYCHLNYRCDRIQLYPQPEVAVTFADRQTLQWAEASACHSYSYEIAAGSLGGLPVGSQPASERCLQATDPTVQDLAVPDEGQGFWYVVRGVFQGIGPWHGSYGRQVNQGTTVARTTSVCP